MADSYLVKEREPESEIHSRGSGMLPGAFLHRLVTTISDKQIARGAPINTFARSRLAQFWFGPYASIHYEVWVHDRTAQLEIGLHCEATPDYNRALFVEFDRCMVEIQSNLGPQFWLEEWDRGWIRLYETHPLWPLDKYRVEEVATRLGEIIDALQPILERLLGRMPHPPAAETVRGERRARSHR
jgi:hypothetical protein